MTTTKTAAPSKKRRLRPMDPARVFGREIRFRRTTLEAGTGEAWVPVYIGNKEGHGFLGYYEARPTLEEATQATEAGTTCTGHTVIGYANIRVEFLGGLLAPEKLHGAPLPPHSGMVEFPKMIARIEAEEGGLPEDEGDDPDDPFLSSLPI